MHAHPPLQHRFTGTALAVLLHVAVAAWWLSGNGQVTPPMAPVQTMMVSLLNADQPAPPQPESRPNPAPAQKPQPATPRQISTPARSDAPAAEAAPAPTATASSAAPAAAASNGPPAEQPALVPPRFDAAYLNNPPPPYPGMSRRLNETGRVLLRVKVSAEGLPTEIDIAQSSGFPRLDEAAREAVRGWKFVPARQGDKPVAAAVNVPVAFKLN